MLRITVRRDQKAATAAIINNYNIGDPDSVSQRTHGVPCIIAMDLHSRRPKDIPALTARHRQPLAMGLRTLSLDHKRMEKNCMIRRITFSCSSHQWARANTTISNRKSGSRMHSWSEISLWRLYYLVGDVFKVCIRTHNPHRTIPDVCTLPERR